MNLLFSPNHVHLCAACYPPSSTLATAGPDYSPNSQELSRLTYYASNHPSKLNKLGSELEKRLKPDCRKAANGNLRARSSLLITLNIFRSLATECRRDLSLLSASLISALQLTLTCLPSDLEVCAKVASVFTVWTTYTNGQLIGADSSLTANYMSILRSFSTMGSVDTQARVRDEEQRNRTCLLGFAGITSALNSEALYNDTAQYRQQVSVMMQPILANILNTPVPLLEEQSALVKDEPAISYFSQFRSRPTIERRAASIHVHIDGDKGPSLSDVASSCLRALNSVLHHANGAQLGHVVQASLDCLDSLNGWDKLETCRWLAGRLVDWSQYQYRFAIPTRLVERLISIQDISTTKPQHLTLAAMISSVFSSPTPLINVSTSDVISSLSSVLLRRVNIDAQSPLPHALVDCIASLGRHVYYSDQIQDLAAELITSINNIDGQSGLPSAGPASRSESIVLLLKALVGLMQAAQRGASKGGVSTPGTNGHAVPTDRSLARSRISPDTWLDTLHLIHDTDQRVRCNYTTALLFYLSQEIPNTSDGSDSQGVERPSPETLREGESGRKLLNNLQGRLFMLAMTTAQGSSLDSDAQVLTLQVPDNVPQLNVHPATPTSEHAPSPVAKSSDAPTPSPPSTMRPPRSRKGSTRMLDRFSDPSISITATPVDYSHMIQIITTIIEQLPVSGLVTGVPMLAHLSRAADTADSSSALVLKEMVARVWSSIGKTWDCIHLSQMAEKALGFLSEHSQIPHITYDLGVFPARVDESQSFSGDSKDLDISMGTVDLEQVMTVLTSSLKIQHALNADKQGLVALFTRTWTPEAALNDASQIEASLDSNTDEVSPLLKITPALMHIENLSLQSLARSVRGVGVTDLREALEGRSSMSNPALVKPPSVSTLDHATSSIFGMDPNQNRLTPISSRTRTKKRPAMVTNGTGEVRDVLTRLGIGKQSQQPPSPSNLLKASFPVLQKSQ